MLAWTKKHHAKAAAEGLALVKLQVQLKHCGQGNYEAAGAYDKDQALVMYLAACIPQGDPRIAKALAALQEKPLPECHKPGGGDCTRDDGVCRRLGHCVFDKCDHGHFYNEVCVPCGRGVNPGRVLVHDDGPCANGKYNTPLVNGYCPVCGIHPDMQSTAIITVPE